MGNIILQTAGRSLYQPLHGAAALRLIPFCVVRLISASINMDTFRIAEGMRRTAVYADPTFRVSAQPFARIETIRLQLQIGQYCDPPDAGTMLGVAT